MDESPTSASGVFSALRITSITSILIILFGIATNKVIAVVSGTEGVGLIGLYRTLGTILTATLPLGVNELIMQRISTAKDSRVIERVIGSARTFLFLQSLAVVAIAALFARPIAAAIFPPAKATTHLWEVRLVLVLSIGVLGLQNVTATLNGLLRVRDVNRVSLITSALTLATVYPFLLLGNLGLTLVIGATCFVGMFWGLRYIRSGLGWSPLSGHAPRTVHDFLIALPISASLVMQPILNSGSALAVQSMISRHYGLDSLGFYNAASMVETTAVMVLMASMRSYYLPTLGRIADEGEKRAFINKILLVLLVLLLSGVTLLLLGAPLIVRLLFTAWFAPAQGLIGVLAISMVGQVFVWCGAMFLLHKADYRTFVALDAVWAILRIGGTALCVRLDAPLEGVAWVHAACYTISAIGYGIVIARKYSDSIFDQKNAMFGALVLASSVSARFLVLGHGFVVGATFGVGVALVVAWAGRHALRRLRA